MPSVAQSTVWGQLAGLNAAAGSIPFIAADNTTPILDAANLVYDQNLKHLYIGGDNSPAYAKYGSADKNGLTVVNGIDSYVSIANQALNGNFAEHSVSSSNGTGQVPVFSADGDLLGKFTGRGLSSTNPGTVPAIMTPHAGLEIYADGSTGGVLPTVGNVGGKLLFRVKQNGGALRTAITIGQDLSAIFAGSFTVLGAIVFAGGISATAFIPTVSAAIPNIGMYSDVANNIDLAIGGAKVATITAAAVSWTQSLSAVGLTSTGAVSLSPANLGVVISPTGTGTVTISPVGALTINPTAASTINNASIGVTTAAAGKFTTLQATSTVTLSPAGVNVVISPTGAGLVTINPATVGALDNLIIGANTPLAGTFTTFTATGAVALSPANLNVVISPTGTGIVTVNPATAGSLNNIIIGAATPLAITGTIITGNSFVPNSATLPTNGLYLSAANIPAIAARSLIAVSFTNPVGAVNNFAFSGSSSTADLTLSAAGTDATINIQYIVKGTARHRFFTNTTAEQLQILHTAGATNFIQITGSNAGAPSITTSAGDIQIISSSGSVYLGGTTTATASVKITSVAASVNYVRLLGAATGNRINLLAEGTDGTIGINLQVKGADAVWFVSSLGNIASFTCSSAPVNYLSLGSANAGANAFISPVGGNLQLGTGAAIATTATDGYIIISSCAGAPTGVPTGNGAGKIAMQYDTTNNKIWFYNGAWRGVVVA